MSSEATRKLHQHISSANTASDDFELGAACCAIARNEGGLVGEIDFRGYTALDWAVTKQKIKTVALLADILVEQNMQTPNVAIAALNKAIRVAENLDFHVGACRLRGTLVKFQSHMSKIRSSDKFGKPSWM